MATKEIIKLLKNNFMPKNKKPSTGIDLKQLRRYISKYYGGRCKTYLWGCPDCMAWRLYDEAKDFNDFSDEIKNVKRNIPKKL